MTQTPTIKKQSTTDNKSEMKPINISGDKIGPFALMPSQSGGKPHVVRFVEPRKSIPHSFSCDCKSYEHRKRCVHSTSLKKYFSAIYERVDQFSDAFKAAIVAEAEKESTIQAPGLVQRPRKVEAPRKSAFEDEFKKLKLHREMPRKPNQGFQLFR